MTVRFLVRSDFYFIRFEVHSAESFKLFCFNAKQTAGAEKSTFSIFFPYQRCYNPLLCTYESNKNYPYALLPMPANAIGLHNLRLSGRLNSISFSQDSSCVKRPNSASTNVSRTIPVLSEICIEVSTCLNYEAITYLHDKLG